MGMNAPPAAVAAENNQHNRRLAQSAEQQIIMVGQCWRRQGRKVQIRPVVRNWAHSDGGMAEPIHIVGQRRRRQQVSTFLRGFLVGSTVN